MRIASPAVLVCLAAGLCAQQPASAPPKQPSEVERAVQEFKIQTANLGLRGENSRRKPRNIEALKDWHGRLYENFRNDFLDAIPHEIRQRGESKSLLRRNQFGFNIAGPFVFPGLTHGKNGTYVSLSYEGVDEHISRTRLATIPTVPERTGDYSHVVDQAGSLLPIFDPQSTRLNPAFNASQPVSLTNLQYLRDPFPGNAIPANRLSPIALNALPLYPEPNVAVGPFFQNNYFVNTPETNTAGGMIGKVDHAIHERQRISAELAFSNGLLDAAPWFPTIANPGPSNNVFTTRRGSMEHVFTASAQTVNTATVEASSSTSRSGVDSAPFPDYQFQPYLSMGRSYPASKNARNTYVFTDGISTRWGKHSLRASAQYVLYQVNTYWPQYPSGYFRFSPGLTSLPGIIDTGHAFASFLLGLPEYAEQSFVGAPSYFRRNDASLSFRDHYDLRKGLALSIGLTAVRQTPRVEKYNRQSTIDLSAVNPANGLDGALVAAGLNGESRGFRPVVTRFNPSASLAWNLTGDSKTVFRASYYRSYYAVPIYEGQWGTQGFNGYETFISPNVQLAPATQLALQLPPPAHPLPDLRPDAANNTVADLIDQSSREPLYQSASVSIERELPGSMVVSAGASYSGGRNLAVSDDAANPNAIPLSALSFRDQLNDETFNASLRPYPQYKGFQLYSSYPVGRYQRDAGFVRVEKRASKGLSVSAYYEFSKQLDDYSGPYGIQDFYNRRNDWSLTAYNQPQRLQLSYSYELPLGPNKPFLTFPDWRRYLVDGWSFSGTAAVASGTPVALHPEFNNTGNVVSALNVNVVPGVDPQVANPGPAQWFNPAAFDQPPDFTIGDASRTSPTLRNPGTQDYDLSLSKRFTVGADRAVELNASGFNFLNHANWNDPDPVIGPASAPNVNAGKIIGSRGGRVIQLGVRFSF
ncbi:MAG TPA: hypothetical protein VJN43_13840 [Bryobacteraceae bacterium]|nr:hypothetical protein [Bryobacteraceae bacterium]